MPYYLSASGDDYVDFATDFQAPSTSIEIRIEFSFNASDCGILSSEDGSSTSQGAFRIEPRLDGEVNVLFTFDGKGRVIRNLTGWGAGDGTTVQELRVNWDSTSQEITTYIDDVLQTTNSNYSSFDMSAIKYIFRRQSTSTAGTGIQLYRLEITRDGTLYDYDPSASGGTGSILPDTVGGNDGTLVNFPTDDSQWVFYGGGPAYTSTVSATWPLLSVSSSQSQTLNNISSTVDATWPLFSASANQELTLPSVDSAVSTAWPMFSASADITAQVPNYTTDISSTWPLFSVSASQDSAVPSYNSSVTTTWPLFAINADQSQDLPAGASTVQVQWPMFSVASDQTSTLPDIDSTVAATWPLFSVSANQDQTLPSGATTVQAQWPMFGVVSEQASTVPEYTAGISATWPLFSIDSSQEQTLPSNGAIVDATWPMFGVSTSQTSTVPVYDASINAAWPMFSINAVSGEFDYRTDPRAILTLPFQSRRLTLPYQSRRIVL